MLHFLFVVHVSPFSFRIVVIHPALGVDNPAVFPRTPGFSDTMHMHACFPGMKQKIQKKTDDAHEECRDEGMPKNRRRRIRVPACSKKQHETVDDQREQSERQDV